MRKIKQFTEGIFTRKDTLRKWKHGPWFLSLLLVFISVSGFGQITIDGNPADWCQVFGSTSTVTVKRQFTDKTDGTDNIWTGGASNSDPISSWAWTINGANDKNNIANAGVAYFNGTIYFYADRRANNGDASIGFWFLKAFVDPIAGGTFTGTHTDGDILVVSHFVNGGSQPDYKIYRWQGTGLVEITVPQGNCDAHVAVNLTDISSGCLPYTPKSGSAGTYPANSFFEGNIDLCLLGGGAGFDACYSTFLVETSNSQSLTSSMEDLVIGRLGSIPEIFTLNGSSACQGAVGAGVITLTNSEVGVNYTLKTSAGNATITTQAGTGSALTWTGLSAGSYYVEAVNATTNCSSIIGPALVTINQPPPALVISGNTFCSSAAATSGVISSTTSQSGASYQLYNSSNVAVQSPQTGTGSSLTWTGLTAGTGYYIIGTGTTSCTSTSNTANITSVPNPTALVISGNTFCASAGATSGVISSTTSASGVSYQLYNSSNVAVQAPKNGTGSSLTWTGLSAGTGYYVIGTGTASCTSTSNTTNITSVPNPVALVISGNTFCSSAGATSGVISSTTSESGVSYQLFNSSNVAVQSPKAGTGSSLTWSGLTAGTGYYVVGTGTFSCTSTSNTANITSVPNPTALVISGNTFCTSAGATSGVISSTTSASGVSYQLYNSSNVAVQAPKAGTGSALTWTGLTAGTGYYVVGTGTFSCTSTSNTTNVTSVANPAALVISGNTFCSSAGATSGVISSTTSESGVSYQLFNSSNVAVQSPKTGTGSSLTWTGLNAGTGYYVVGTGTGSCTSTSNTTNITSVPNPAALVISGNTFCSSAGATSGVITSTTSAVGVSYQLFNSSNVAVQSPKAGTGSSLTWSGLNAGTGYYVVSTGTFSCTSTSNTTNITSVPNPVALVISGNSFCPDASATSGVISSTTSAVGVMYQLFNSSNVAVQAPKAGTGSSLTWTGLTAGTGYYVVGTGTFSCTSTSNSTNISTFGTPTVTASATPTTINLFTLAHNSVLTALGYVNAVQNNSLFSSFTWSNYPGLGLEDGTAYLSSTSGATVTFTAPNNFGVSYGFLVTATTTNGCTATATVIVTTNGGFNCPGITSPGVLCINTAGTFTATGSIPTGVHYTWTAEGATINGAYQDVTAVSVTPIAETYTVTLTASFDNTSLTPVACVVTETATNCETKGCTLGFWKTHPAIWDNSGDEVVMNMGTKAFTTSTTFSSYFGGTYGINGISSGTTMLQVLNLKGGGCVALARNAIAALLSKGAFGSDYGYTGSISDLYNEIVAAFTAGGSACTTLNGTLDGYNNSPLEYLCSSLGDPGASFNNGRLVSSSDRMINNLSVTAAPNPFFDKVRFVISTPVDGKVELEVVNILGQKVGTVYNGFMKAHTSQSVEYSIPPSAPQNLIYILRSGKEQVTGKLLRANR